MVPGCCDNGRPLTIDRLTGHPTCVCKYQHEAMPLHQLYDSAPPPQHAYPTLKPDPTTFYSRLVGGAGYDASKDPGVDAWRAMPHAQPGLYFPYETVLSSYPYGPSWNAQMGFDAARRKNATKEATNSLKAWLYEHRKNPYPTKGEKIMLAIITKMTMTQISTWFANARRRLKKENKMTWSPKSKSDDEDSDDDAERDVAGCDVTMQEDETRLRARLLGNVSHEDPCYAETSRALNTSSDGSSTPTFAHPSSKSRLTSDGASPSHSLSSSPKSRGPSSPSPEKSTDGNELSEKPNKPKIWSISQVLSDDSSTESRSRGPGASRSDRRTSSSNPNQSQFYTAHASHVLNGQGFAILSGNGGAIHTWNPLSLPSGLYPGQPHIHAQHRQLPLTLKFPSSLAASRAHVSSYPGYQHRVPSLLLSNPEK